SLADEQDIRKMGGLVQKMPLAFIAVSLGSFALIGAPFIGGFYSKGPIMDLRWFFLDYMIAHYLCIYLLFSYFFLLVSRFCLLIFSWERQIYFGFLKRRIYFFFERA